MILVETCPNCGNNIQTIILTSFPPIPKKICNHCGWTKIGEPEKVVFKVAEDSEGDNDEKKVLR